MNVVRLNTLLLLLTPDEIEDALRFVEICERGGGFWLSRSDHRFRFHSRAKSHESGLLNWVADYAPSRIGFAGHQGVNPPQGRLAACPWASRSESMAGSS